MNHCVYTKEAYFETLRALIDEIAQSNSIGQIQCLCTAAYMVLDHATISFEDKTRIKHFRCN